MIPTLIQLLRPLEPLWMAALVGTMWAGLAPSGAPQDEDAAQESFERAEELARRGKYPSAVKAYAKVAKKFPDTEAGRAGARRSLPNAFLGAVKIVDNGPSSNRVDVAIMGDGYTLAHQRAFDDLADDVPRYFEQQATMGEYSSYFNFHRYNVVSEDDNVDGYGREESTALGGYTRGTVQGHVAIDASMVREILSQGPEHDGLAIAYVRTGILGSGSPGIACVGGRSARTTIHEWGHAFARLGDEYSLTTHERGAVSNRPNVSATDDPNEVPWAHWLDPRVPGIGIYQGAAGQERGAWKPTSSGCVMQAGEFFCRPCREELVLRIYRLVDPIDGTDFPPIPFKHPASIDVDGHYKFTVHVMEPKRHAIEVSWWIFPEESAPRDPRPLEERYATQSDKDRQVDRRGRGALEPIEQKPDRIDRTARSSSRSFTIRAVDLEPGRYRVICRARDTTLLRGQKHPWVRKDEFGLLESERAWWIRVE